jgi:hypothetical protein
MVERRREWFEGNVGRRELTVLRHKTVAALGGLAFVWDGRLAHDIHINGVLMSEGLSDNEIRNTPTYDMPFSKHFVLVFPLIYLT